ncbi:hypothetical protein IWQ61_009494, partial [Dispira simplex]
MASKTALSVRTTKVTKTDTPWIYLALQVEPDLTKANARVAVDIDELRTALAAASLMDTDGLTAPSGLEVSTSTPVGGLAESLDSSTDKPTPAELNAYLNGGRKAVEDMSSVDIKYPATDDLLQIATSGEYHQQLFGDTELFQKSRTVPLPDALFDQYDLLNCRCCMGLFPEIHRVWITIDHRLFLWNY